MSEALVYPDDGCPGGAATRGQRGFTLIEMMVAIVLFSFAIAGVLSVAVSITRGVHEQKLVVNAESTARAAMDFIGDAVRGASPGVISGQIADFNSTSCQVGPFRAVDSSTAPDELTVLFSYGGVATSSLQSFTQGQSTLNVSDTTGFATGDFLLITDNSVGHMVRVTGVASATQLSVASSAAVGCATPPSPAVTFPTSGYSRGSLVVRVLWARFFVQNLDGVPTLWLDPDGPGTATAEPLAEGVEDFQVQLGVDAANDGISDASSATDEWYGNHASDTALAWPATASVRAVRLTLVVRSTGQVTGVASYYRPAAGNRAASSTADNFRRRVLQTTIEIRNQGDSL